VLADISEKCGLTFCYEEYLRPGEDVRHSRLFDAPVKVAVTSVNVWQALDALSKETGEFVWSRDGDVVNIIATRCTRIRDYPMNTVLRKVKFGGDWRDLLEGIRELSRRFRDRAGSYARDKRLKPRAVELEMEGVTARQFLNAFCRRSGAYWASDYNDEWDYVTVTVHGKLRPGCGRAGAEPVRPSSRETTPDFARVLVVKQADPPEYSEGPPIGNAPPMTEGPSEVGTRTPSKSQGITEAPERANGSGEAPRTSREAWLIPVVVAAGLTLAFGLLLLFLRRAKRER